MAKTVQQTFTKDDFLPPKTVALEYHIPFEHALAVMQHLYKNNMTISFTSGQSTVYRPAVIRVSGTGLEILKLHPMANNLFNTEYERMKKTGKLPTQTKAFLRAKENTQKMVEKATTTLIKIRQAKGKD